MNDEHRAPWACVYAKEEQNQCKPGRTPNSDQEYFEILCLCILQAGLNWGVIRKNWQKYKKGFFGFNITKLAATQTSELLKKSDVIKHVKKIEAIIYNAKEFQRIQNEYGQFVHFLDSLRQRTNEEVLKVLSKQFKHVGNYTAEYYLHAVGYWT